MDSAEDFVQSQTNKGCALVRWTAVFSTVLDLIGSALELIQPVAAVPVQLVNTGCFATLLLTKLTDCAWWCDLAT